MFPPLRSYRMICNSDAFAVNSYSCGRNHQINIISVAIDLINHNLLCYRSRKQTISQTMIAA